MTVHRGQDRGGPMFHYCGEDVSLSLMYLDHPPGARRREILERAVIRATSDPGG